MNQATGELRELRWEPEGDAVRKFYAALPAGALVDLETRVYPQWLQSLLAELRHELQVGEAAEMRAASVRQQKTDARDAQLLLQ